MAASCLLGCWEAQCAKEMQSLQRADPLTGALRDTHLAPAAKAGRRPALPCGSSGSKGVESSCIAGGQDG